MLAQGGGRVVSRVWTGIVVHMICSEEGINCQERSAAERVLISRGDVKGRDLRSLVLAQLVIGIGNLKPVPGAQHVEMKGIPGARHEVEVIENGTTVPDGV